MLWGFGNGPCSRWAPAGAGAGAAPGVASEAEDGAGPAVGRGSSWKGGCLRERNWLRRESKGVLHRQVPQQGTGSPCGDEGSLCRLHA